MYQYILVWYGGEGFFSWFLAFIHFLYITQVLPIIFPLKSIYSQIVLFYTKYFVLTFSIDIASPLSNCNNTLPANFMESSY